MNIDERDQPPNKELFDKYFEGESIPYTVLVDEQSQVRKKWSGAMSYRDMVAEIKGLETQEEQSE